MLRIIAGEWRGRRLVAPEGMDTRPTADRTRETLFSMLTSRLGGFTGFAVADLYAGSGALGFEALSRGAASCLFADKSGLAVKALRANAATLGAGGVDIRQIAVESLAPPIQPYDLILLDPPYGTADIGGLIDRLAGANWLTADGIIALETGKAEQPDFASADVLVDRAVGKARLHLLRGT
jgi:16S rRNA (guanine966-N2)-methyltransferase